MSKDYGFFLVYVNSHKKNFEKVKKIIFEQFERLQNLNEEELNNAKKFIEGDFILEHEDTHTMCDEITYREFCNKAEDFETHIEKINKVTLKQVKEIAKKYLTENYSEAIIQQKN